MLHLWKNIIGYFFTFSLPDELYKLSSFTLKFQLKVYQSEVKSLSRILLFVTPWIVFMDSLWPHELPGFSVHGIFQARILEWVAISFSGRSSWPRDWTQVSRIIGGRFTIWATREVLSVSNLWIILWNNWRFYTVETLHQGTCLVYHLFFFVFL